METRTLINNYGTCTYKVVVPSMKVILVYSPSGDAYFQDFSTALKHIGGQYGDLIIDISATKFAEDCYIHTMEGDPDSTLASVQIMEICEIWNYTCDKTYKFIVDSINSYLSIGTDLLVVNMNNDSHPLCTGRVLDFCEKSNITCASVSLQSCVDTKISSLETSEGSKRVSYYTLIYNRETRDDIISLFYKQYMGV